MTKPKVYYGLHFSSDSGSGMQLNPFGRAEPIWADGETRVANLDKYKRPIPCKAGYHAFPINLNPPSDDGIMIVLRNRKQPVRVSYVKLSGYPRIHSKIWAPEIKICATTKTVLALLIEPKVFLGEDLKTFGKRLWDAGLKLQQEFEAKEKVNA